MYKIPFKIQIKLIINSIPMPYKLKRKIKRIYNKYKMKFHKFNGRMRIYLTFECTLKCKYCVNDFCPDLDKKLTYELLPAESWIKIINRTKRNVIFTGGEPFLHPEFIEIINGIDQSIAIKIYTNFTCDIEQFIREVNRPVSFYGSYHPCSGYPKKFLACINKLREAGKFSGTVHAVLWDKQADFLKEMVALFKSHGWDLLLDEEQTDLFESASQKFRKKASCKQNLILIAPDGTRYQCASKMIRRIDPRENLLNEPLKGTWVSCLCSDYGYCAPCDGTGEKKQKVLE